MNLPFPSRAGQTPALHVSPALLLGSLLLVLAMTGPAFAQRCSTNQNGQTICCDNNGNCYSK
ncbi:MAG: hypothetical protein ACK55E_06085 [Cyanobacteriota bacterium]|jgi:hypothetical protein